MPTSMDFHSSCVRKAPPFEPTYAIPVPHSATPSWGMHIHVSGSSRPWRQSGLTLIHTECPVHMSSCTCTHGCCMQYQRHALLARCMQCPCTAHVANAVDHMMRRWEAQELWVHLNAAEELLHQAVKCWHLEASACLFGFMSISMRVSGGCVWWLGLL
jgi:hypothetical protein